MNSSALRTPNLNDWLYIAAGILLVLTGMQIFYAFHRAGPNSSKTLSAQIHPLQTAERGAVRLDRSLKAGQLIRYLNWLSGLCFIIVGVWLAWPVAVRILFPGH